MTADPIVFGAVPAEDVGAVEDVTFDDVTLGPGGYPTESASVDAPAAEPPTYAPPADRRATPVGVHAGSDLERLFAEVGQDLDMTPVTLPVPVRPGFAASYRLLLDQQEMGPWRRAAYDPSELEGIDQLKLACLGLAELNTALLLDGRPVLDDNGEPITFRSARMLERTRAATKREDVTAADALRHFYAMDATVTSSWSTVLGASGYGIPLHPIDTIATDAAPELPDPS